MMDALASTLLYDTVSAEKHTLHAVHYPLQQQPTHTPVHCECGCVI